MKKRFLCFILAFFFIINCSVNPVHANPLAGAIPVFTGAVGTVSVASVATIAGVILLVGASCYGIYKLSQPSTQQALRAWANNQAKAVQAGTASFGVYVDSKGKLFCDNIGALKKSLDDTFLNRSDAVPAFPGDYEFVNSPFHFKTLYSNLSEHVRSVTVYMPDDTANIHTHVYTLYSQNAVTLACGFNDDNTIYAWSCQRDCFVKGKLTYDRADYYRGTQWADKSDSFSSPWYHNGGLPYVLSVEDMGVDGATATKSLDVYPNMDKSKDFTYPTGATAVSFPVGQDTANSVPQDLTKATPIQNVTPVKTSSTDTDTPVTGFWSTLWSWLEKILAAITAIPGVIGQIATAVKDLPTYFPKVLGFLEAIPGPIGVTANAVKDLPGFLSKVGDYVTAFPTAIATDFSNLKDWITDLPSSISDSIKNILPDWTIPDTVSLDFTPLEKAGDSFTHKFPFCLPWDVVGSFKELNSIKGTPPKWSISFNKPPFNVNYTMVLDFSIFEKFAGVVRWGLTALFVISLIWATRKIIGG